MVSSRNIVLSVIGQDISLLIVGTYFLAFCIMDKIISLRDLAVFTMILP
jgi:hypothetical protein